MSTPTWLTAYFTEAVTISHRSRAATGGYGAEEFTVDDTTEIDVQIDPVASAEVLDGQATRIVTHLLIGPAGMQLGADDLIDDGTNTYEVVGPVRRHQAPPDDGTGEDHVEADLVVVTG